MKKALFFIFASFLLVKNGYSEIVSVEVESPKLLWDPDAKKHCPGVCKAEGMSWNKNWKKTGLLEKNKSTCGCSAEIIKVKAKASLKPKKRCPILCQNQSPSMKWSGKSGLKWCGCYKPITTASNMPESQNGAPVPPEPQPIVPAPEASLSNLEAGPIWNNDDANGKCPKVCTDKNMTWTGDWWTTVRGEMSVCTCKKV